ncbi:MAG: glutamine--fructose-6-phosphate transaminase (isomerizing) [Defluviitaleaceae bacterium]|nr:glutamine--fructose-6-phosphate transaminase (isomerizing) [Defluviitaleaceae bacterium]
MCGIVGYIGNKGATHILIKSLKRLEYRGYDSSGIAILNKKLKIVKAKGKIINLEEKLKKENLNGNLGIAHTRWATHGEPSDINSHPHTSNNGLFTIVHNGILENYKEIKNNLQKEGYNFLSDTDTEVISNFIEYQYEKTKDLLESISKFLKEGKGSFSLGILFENENTIYTVKKQSPLVIGIGTNENFISSDISATLEYTKNYYILEEEEIGIVKKDNIQIFDKNKNEIKKDIYVVDFDVSAAEKNGFDHFMLKEIYEQPTAIRNTINPRVINDEIDLKIDIDAKEINKIHVVACGSAAHAGIVFKNIVESLARIPTEVYLASEFRYQNPILEENDLILVISQSGETADTLAALRHGKTNGVKTLSIVNVLGSSIARESDLNLFTWAGPEIAVATTKAYSAQISLLYLLGIKFAFQRKKITKETEKLLVGEILTIPEKIENILKISENQIKELSKKYKNNKSIFFIGRGLDYAAVLEGSLKLKEISYIHSEAYAAGELKHGTISLIEDRTLVISCITQKHIFEKTMSNLQEVKARGAESIIITNEEAYIKEINVDVDKSNLLIIPKINDYFTPSLTAIYMQLFSYYISRELGSDIDMPRNLAKSVTVE